MMINQDKIIKTYPVLTKNLKDCDIEEYELGILLVCIDEYKASYKQLAIHEATDDGTEVEYALLNSEEEKDEYKKHIMNLIEEFKNKYNRWDLISLLDV